MAGQTPEILDRSAAIDTIVFVIRIVFKTIPEVGSRRGRSPHPNSDSIQFFNHPQNPTKHKPIPVWAMLSHIPAILIIAARTMQIQQIRRQPAPSLVNDRTSAHYSYSAPHTIPTLLHTLFLLCSTHFCSRRTFLLRGMPYSMTYLYLRSDWYRKFKECMKLR